MNTKLVALVASSFALLASAAHASPPTAAHEVVVRYADLNLETAAGIDHLYSRLRAAAHGACGATDRMDLARVAEQKACYARALNAAVARVGNAALTARHASQPEARYAEVMDGRRS
jgi:UrcA family protein